MLKRARTHLIKPGKQVTPNGLIETFCMTLYFDHNASEKKADADCKKCLTANYNYELKQKLEKR